MSKPNYNLHPTVKYITHNENWDISREEEGRTVIFNLHDTLLITNSEIKELQKYAGFICITRCTDGLAIQLSIPRMLDEIEVIRRSISDDL